MAFKDDMGMGTRVYRGLLMGTGFYTKRADPEAPLLCYSCGCVLAPFEEWSTLWFINVETGKVESHIEPKRWCLVC